MSKLLVAGERKDKLKHVKISDIICSGRAREELGDIDELEKSISDKGVIQPITLDTDFNLLAGGRRYTACVNLGFSTIPAIVRDNVDELDAKEIELIENIHRKDFTWQERAKLTAAIDTLYRQKDPTWNQRKSANLMDSSLGNINKQLQLAQAITIMPEIAECKTENDAVKMVKQLQERALVQELRRRQDHQTSAPSIAGGVDAGIASALKQAKDNYQLGDVFSGMAKLRTSGHISIIECDPPYGIDLHEKKGNSQQVDNIVHGYKEIDSSVYENFLDKLTAELFRIAGKDCWLVFWFGPTWQKTVLDSLRRSGWNVDEIPAIWVKPQGQTLQPELYYARCYEPFFLCRKGKPIMAERGRSNVFNYSGATAKYHPTQRPVELIEEIFATLSSGMDTVFIPFLGSGATLRACYNRGLNGFGFDLDGKYKDKFLLAVEEDTRKLFRG